MVLPLALASLMPRLGSTPADAALDAAFAASPFMLDGF